MPAYILRQRENAIKAAKDYRVSFLPPLPSLKPKPIPISSQRLPIETSPWAAWTNPAVDRLICSLDALGFSTLEIIYRVKKEFPVLCFRVITGEMVERRIQNLDQQPELDYFKHALTYGKEQVEREVREIERARQLGLFISEDDEETSTRKDALGDTQANASALSNGKLHTSVSPPLELQMAQVEEVDETSDAASRSSSAAEHITSRGARQGQRIHQSTHSQSTVALGDDYDSAEAQPLPRSHPTRAVKHGRAMHHLAAKNVDDKQKNPDTGAFAGPLSSSINSASYSRGARHGQAIQKAAFAPLRDVSNISPGTTKKGPLRVINGFDHDLEKHASDGDLAARATRPDSVGTEQGSTPAVFKKKRSVQDMSRVRIRGSMDTARLKEMKNVARTVSQTIA
ncbi:MAG: hypothetical protein M1828_007514 [Chrysothrix sp. TS-e1954]|nr:MAG: hypothetical protein M1828_007514 [Chrysothrix sp. TS-e1954]